MTPEDIKNFINTREKLINYFGDDKPKAPRDCLKAFVHLKLKIPTGLRTAAKKKFGKDIFDILKKESKYEPR